MEETTPTKKKKLNLITVLLIIAGLIWLGVISAFMWKIPDINKVTNEEIKKVITLDTTKEAELETIKGKPMPGVNVNEVGFPNQKLLDKGEALFKSTCSSCHGEKGMGDGAGGATLNPKPRNFTKTDGWKNGRNISAMFKTLYEGIPGSGMIAYEFLPIEDRFGVMHYIRKMVGSFPEITTAELKQIDDIYDLASPRLSASQIPLTSAKLKIIEDNGEITKKIEKLEKKLNQTRIEEGILFKNIISDRKKAIATLYKNTTWHIDFNYFVHLITDNSSANGFKPSAMKLSNDEMKKLYSFALAFFILNYQ